METIENSKSIIFIIGSVIAGIITLFILLKPVLKKKIIRLDSNNIYEWSLEERECLVLINKYRKAHNLRPLIASILLYEQSTKRNKELNIDRPKSNLKTIVSRYNKSLLKTFNSPLEISWSGLCFSSYKTVRSWKNSHTKREVLKDPNITSVGIVVTTFFKSASGYETITIVTATFGEYI
jgi:hypothetical protein